MSVMARNDLSPHIGQRTNANGPVTKLNLVSLMDIFTILVFFLMLNTGEVEVLQPDEKIALPKSFAQLRPDHSPVIKVAGDAIYFREEAIVTVNDLRRAGDLIEPLYQSLHTYKENLPAKNKVAATQSVASSIAIMGDAGVNYALLKKVLYTCAQAGFRDVSLAVEYTSRNSVANADDGAVPAGVGS